MKYKIFNSFDLKIMAILFMTIDHIGYVFYLSDVFRIIGRLALPLFAFMIFQGYQHTRNRYKYFLRLFLFGLLIELVIIIMRLFMYVPTTNINIMLLLSFGVLGFSIIDSKYNVLFKSTLILFLAYMATVLQFDYQWYGFLLILSFTFYPKYSYISIFLHVILTYFFTFDNWIFAIDGLGTLQYYSLFSWVFILMYNGKKGYGLKYFFYFYYPLHLGLLYLIDMFI